MVDGRWSMVDGRWSMVEFSPRQPSAINHSELLTAES
jgi:hypothetical protein